MKRFALMTAALAFMAAPAFATKTTITFTPNEGEPVAVVFDNETNMAIIGDVEAPYVLDADAKTICGDMPDGTKSCATFDEVPAEPSVGFSTGYTSTDGTKGFAEITAIE